MSRAIVILAAVTAVLLGALALVRDPARWPPPESPPQQGEAANATHTGHAAARGETHVVTHSPVALARLVREPQNTWSNLAFIAGGAWLIARSRRATIRAAGVALIAVGIGSFLYHASVSRTLRHADVAAMNWLFFSAATVCVATWHSGAGHWLERHASVVPIIMLAAAGAVTVSRNLALGSLKPFSLTVVTAITATIVIGTLTASVCRRKTRNNAATMLGIVTLFGIAVACQLSDRPGGRFFQPESAVQLHAFWHVLAAGAFTAAMRFLDEPVAQSLAAPDEKDQRAP